MRTMNGFENKVLSYIQKNHLTDPGDKILVGFSGGADSTALLAVLSALRRLLSIDLVAVHVNHMIRQEADSDEEFCREFCARLDIPFFAVKKDIPAMAAGEKLTEEEAGRLARYDVFSDILARQQADKIAVAHHENDLAETLLMNLFRGSGLHGAAGIKAVRGNIIRPFLCVTRKEIEEYLAEKDISFCTDATNGENIHTRNIIRNVLMPVIERDINAGAVKHLSRAAADFEKADAYIRNRAKKVFDGSVSTSEEEVLIDLEKLEDEDDIIRENVILLCFEKLTPSRKDITSNHVEAVLSLMNSREGSGSCDLPYDLKARRSYNELRIGKNKATEEDLPEIPVRLSLGEKTEVLLPGERRAIIEVFKRESDMSFPTDTYTKWFDYDRIQEVVFRTAKTYDYIRIEQAGGIGAKPIKKLLTDEKVPREKRKELYLLAKGSEIIWVPGIRMSGAYKISEKTENIMSVSIINGG